MSLTLSDIAREAKVSKMTVSRAINNDPWIKADTRLRVMEVVERLNYKPNHFARALATNRSFLIGVIVPDLMNSYFAEILHAIESIGSKAGYELIFSISEEDINLELKKIKALREQTDGLIIASALTLQKTAVFKEIIEAGTKIVLIDRTLKGLDCPTVTTDNLLVGKLATEHLINLGHQRIGHLRGTHTSISKARLLGYKKALSDNYIHFDKSLIRDCGLMEEDGYHSMQSWIKQGNFPDAVYAVNDQTAVGAMKAIAEANLKVGKDICIVGSGNIHYSDMLIVPLTTVSWSRDEMGRKAALLLIQLIENKESSAQQKITLEPTLIVRKSCGYE